MGVCGEGSRHRHKNLGMGKDRWGGGKGKLGEQGRTRGGMSNGKKGRET